MNNDVISVKPLSRYQLSVQLADGRSGTFDLASYLNVPGLRALRAENYFNQVGVLLGAVTWPNGENVSPAVVGSGLKLHQTA